MDNRASRRRTTGARLAAAVITVGSLLCPEIVYAEENETETESEFWPEWDVFYRFNQKSRLYAMYSATKRDNRATYADGSVGVHLDYFGLRTLRPLLLHPDSSRNQLALFRAGYLFTRIPSADGKSSTEHMPTFEAHGRAPLPWGLLLSDRNRFDFRIVDGVFTPRYRNRLKIEGTIKKGWLELTPYVHAEAFYDWRWHVFHRFRYAAGMEWTLTRMLVLEAYFLRQRDTKSSPPHVNAIGTALQFYFGRTE